MRKILLTIILTILSNFLFAQNAAYYPNGTKIPHKITTINDLKDYLNISETESVDTQFGQVYYKKLTNKPVFILFDKKDLPEKIPLMLKKYNYNEYLYSYSYYYDLNDMMKDGKLTKAYLLNAFGKPTLEAVNDEGIPYWMFKKFNTRIEFRNDSTTRANVINYRAYDLNKLAIFNYKVTGESYSIGFYISFFNLSSKTIKYVYTVVTARNAVNDKIGTKVVRAIGPIKYNEVQNYSFDNIFYSGTAESLSLDAIKIQYMDGSTKQLTKAQVQSVIDRDWEEEGQRTIE